MRDLSPESQEELVELDEQEVVQEKEVQMTDEIKAESLTSKVDVEAAMEEDIAGATTDVSRRNIPDDPTKKPFMDFTSQIPERIPMRSGIEEANWFEQFRQRLTGSSNPQVEKEFENTQEDESLESEPDDDADDSSISQE